jgi:hypothetical protein
MKIEYSAGRDAKAAISRLGRTEDVQFSPDGRRLAVAGHNENRLLILDINQDWEAAPPAVALTSSLEVESDALQKPHGICWIDDRTMAVANRIGRLVIFELPEKPASKRIRLTPIRIFGDQANNLLTTPGSVSVVPIGLDLLEFIVCNNYVHDVSRHLVDRRDGYSLIASEILVQDGLAVPDGVALSPSRRWIAVSNHGHHNVLLYRSDSDLGPGSSPQAVLSGVEYPHGVRFADNGKAIIVADAGAPYVHLYRSDGEWAGERQPDASLRVLSEESFTRGRLDVANGGPKGVDITRDGKLMIVSCEEEPLVFFDVRAFLDQREAARPSNMPESETVREALLRYVSSEQIKVEAATSAIRRATDLELGRLTQSRSWRLTAPLRWGTAAIRRKAPGWSAKHL